MATIHISEIQKLLAERGESDALPYSPGGYFLEIRFDDPASKTSVIDNELKDAVITADCAFGFVTIQFDETGKLKSIDLS
ncbi:MAG: hypothetical protein IPN69_20770 [Acidobacteria bacterium]|nr:hypothetical protein [Acidobacteriota bacterium]MBK7706999.1 hypothetical protein [Acidobacteriota bacterium]MBK8146912.1 hypothetical protein [Acidobacteriota bacterium]MBK8813143.1 hypothetical protein [Acidobacteriota bacterium]